MNDAILAEIDQEAAKAADLVESLSPMERVLVQQAMFAAMQSPNPALVIMGTLAGQGLAAALASIERKREMGNG